MFVKYEADAKYDDQKKSLPPDGVADAKSANDLENSGNRDRSNLAVAVKEEGPDEAAKEAGGQASSGEHHSESRSADNCMDEKSGEQPDPLSGVQRVGNNNGGLMDIPELPEIPELKFNEGDEGQRRKQEQRRRGEGEGEGEQFHRRGPVASGGTGPLPSASSPSSSLPSGMSRREEEMSQHMAAAGESVTVAFPS